jgi:hypothetical protein
MGETILAAQSVDEQVGLAGWLRLPVSGGRLPDQVECGVEIDQVARGDKDWVAVPAGAQDRPDDLFVAGASRTVEKG